MRFQNKYGLKRYSFAFIVLLAAAFSTLAQEGWMATRVSAATGDLNTVFFLDSKRGWVGGDSGFLGRTDDGGHTWVRQSIGTTDAINDIYFRDKEAGFLISLTLRCARRQSSC